MKRLNTYIFASVLLFLTFVIIVLFVSRSEPEENINPKQGTTLSTKEQNFPVWKTIELGLYYDIDFIRKELKSKGFRVEYWANDILDRMPKSDYGPVRLYSPNKKSIPVDLSQFKSQINLVLVSASQLDFKDVVTYQEILRRAQELGLKLLPAEAGPQLRLQYKDQPEDEWLHIAMNPEIDSAGDPTVFDILHFDNHTHGGNSTHSLHDHSLQLCSSSVRHDVLWSPSSRWVFATN